METLSESGLHALGDWPLAAGGTLREARLGYRIAGRLNAARDNLIVLPTYYTGASDGYSPLVGAGGVFDTRHFCVVAVDLFGNGVSSSPSNAHPDQRGVAFPRIHLADAVAAQRRFLVDALDARGVALVAGWSMGGMQAYQWAADHPAMVRRLLPWCAAARCSPHNHVFLEGVRAALTADPGYAGGRYAHPPERGLRAFARAYCGWAYSAAFFRERGWQALGLPDVEALLQAWEADHLAWDANDLLSKLRTWQAADLGTSDDETFERRLAGIRARAVLMPCATDQYFPPEDNAREAAVMPHARLHSVDSVWGHVAGGPGRRAEFTGALHAAVRELLDDYRPGESAGR